MIDTLATPRFEAGPRRPDMPAMTAILLSALLHLYVGWRNEPALPDPAAGRALVLRIAADPPK